MEIDPSLIVFSVFFFFSSLVTLFVLIDTARSTNYRTPRVVLGLTFAFSFISGVCWIVGGVVFPLNNAGLLGLWLAILYIALLFYYFLVIYILVCWVEIIYLHTNMKKMKKIKYYRNWLIVVGIIWLLACFAINAVGKETDKNPYDYNKWSIIGIGACSVFPIGISIGFFIFARRLRNLTSQLEHTNKASFYSLKITWLTAVFLIAMDLNLAYCSTVAIPYEEGALSDGISWVTLYFPQLISIWAVILFFKKNRQEDAKWPSDQPTTNSRKENTSSLNKAQSISVVPNGTNDSTTLSSIPPEESQPQGEDEDFGFRTV